MGQQFFGGSRKGKGFSSASSVGGSDRISYCKTPTSQPSMTRSHYGEGNSSRSFHNFGQTRRISNCPGHREINYRDNQVGGMDNKRVEGFGHHARNFSFGTPATPGCRSEGMPEFLYLGLDPQDYHIKTHEKEQVKNLNTQFACLIDKVRCLEQRNKELATKWGLMQSQKGPTVDQDLIPLCENYTESIRRKLGCALCEKTQLQCQHKATEDLIEQHRCKYEEEVEKRKNKESEFNLLKQDVDNAFKHRKEMELKKVLLEENIHFLRNFFAKEGAMLARKLQDTSVVVNLDNRRCLDMDAFIQSIESWYQSVARSSKEEVNLFYWNWMENLRKKCFEFNEYLNKTKSEAAELSRLVLIKQSQLQILTKKLNSLQASINEVEKVGDRVLKTSQQKYNKLQNQVQNDKDKLASLVRDYHDLMNTKLALDIEISTYKSLLEGEEHRLYTGMPVNKGVVKTTYAIHNTARH